MYECIKCSKKFKYNRDLKSHQEKNCESFLNISSISLINKTVKPIEESKKVSVCNSEDQSLSQTNDIFDQVLYNLLFIRIFIEYFID